jgi:hypothetical protein
MRAWRKEIMACQEVVEACLESMEQTSLEVESMAVYEEVFKEEAAVKTVGALKKWHRAQHLAIRCCGQLKKHTHGNGGSWKKLAATSRGMIHSAGVAWHKGYGHTETTEKADQGQCCQGNLEKTDFGKRHPAKPESITGIRNQSSRLQLRLRKERTTSNGIRGLSRR